MRLGKQSQKLRFFLNSILCGYDVLLLEGYYWWTLSLPLYKREEKNGYRLIWVAKMKENLSIENHIAVKGLEKYCHWLLKAG